MESAFIDSLEFARTAQELRGEITVQELKRLADSLFDTAGTLKYSLVGGFDAEQRPKLHLEVDGELNLSCQRCLGSLAYRLAVLSDLLVLTASSAGKADDIADLDGVPASAHTDVVALVEDEVLLALPMSPRHAEGMCEIAADGSGKPASPFAVLAQLKRK